MGMIYLAMLYAFTLTSGFGKLLYRLKLPDHCYIVYSNNINHYLDLLIHDQPSHILGIGSYSGVDRDKIRVEGITTNKFRNNKIEENVPDRLEINNFLIPLMSNKNLKHADAMGNSWCNLISWKIMRLIENKTLRSQYSFLHIPKGFNQKLAMQVIDQALNLSLAHLS